MRASKRRSHHSMSRASAREAGRAARSLRISRCGQRRIDRKAGHREHLRERFGIGRARRLQTSTNQLDQGLFAAPLPRDVLRRRTDLRIQSRPGVHGIEHRQLLGGDPEPVLTRLQARSAPLGDQRVEMLHPARRSAFPLGDGAEGNEGIVQLIRAFRRGPRLLAHSGDRLGIERPRSAAVCGSSQRREATACVRRSSSGASSR